MNGVNSDKRERKIREIWKSADDGSSFMDMINHECYNEKVSVNFLHGTFFTLN